jgi:hypothetical protein
MKGPAVKAAGPFACAAPSEHPISSIEHEFATLDDGRPL